jgi:hypothetical protein
MAAATALNAWAATEVAAQAETDTGEGTRTPTSKLTGT